MYCEGWSQRFDFPSPSELVSNAMHLYGPPVQVADLSSDRTQIRLYPCLNFTCSGKIVKLMFIAPVETDSTVTVRWPEFGLWRKCNRSHGEHCDWMDVQRLSAIQQPCLVYMNESQTVGVYELEFTSNNTFEHGNFLGILRPMATSNSSAMNVLYQNGSGYCDALAFIHVIQWTRHNWWWCPSISTTQVDQQPIIPYIAIETGQMCMRNCHNYVQIAIIIIMFNKHFYYSIKFVYYCIY